MSLAPLTPAQSLDAVLSELPVGWLLAHRQGARLAVGPTGVFVLVPDDGDLTARAEAAHELAHGTRAALARHLSWVPFVDAAVVTSADRHLDTAAVLIPLDLLLELLVQGSSVIDVPAISVVSGLLVTSSLDGWQVGTDAVDAKIDLCDPPLQRSAAGAPLTPASFSPVPSTNDVSVAVWALTGSEPSASDRRPILLCHATGFHAGVWSPVARRLRGFEAFAPDLRGHGDTPAPTGRDMEWDGFADDVLAVVDAMTAAGIDTDGLVAAGHSKGGASLLLAEERRPGTFGAVYCYEPVVLPADSGLANGEENPLAQGALRRRDTFESREAAYANYAGKPPFSALDPEALEAYVAHGFVDQPDGTVRLSCRPEIESAVYRMGGAHDAFSHLGEIACPVTIATGAVDTFGPAAFAARIAENIPDGRLVEYPDLGHFGPLEDPARIAAGIIDALSA